MTEFDAIDGQLRLPDWGLIRAEGADALSFLHAQLTQDVEHLGETQARLAGWCSAKGRLLASFVVWREDAQTVLLACSADLLPATLKRLSMFVLRAKCRLADVSAERALYGVAGSAARALAAARLPADAWSSVSAGGARLIRLPAVEGVPRLLCVQAASAPPPEGPALDADTWRWLEVRSGVARIVGATVDRFVPQMVNFELTGGVHFQKGCYPGQEVVARSQYRGTLKRRMALFECEGALEPGQEVFHSGDPGQPAGMVVLAATAPRGGSDALIEVKLAALESGTLHASAATGALLRRATLPYVLPAGND